MTDHTTHDSTQEIQPGYCHCGCGKKTNIAPRTSTRNGWIKGQPIRFIRGHSRRKPIAPAEPKLCECGCGQLSPIAKTTDPRYGYIKGQPYRFIRGHNQRGVPRPRMKTPIAERFWRYVTPGRFDECWLWQGATNGDLGGYGVMTVDGKTVGAHRVSWELHFGPIPDGMYICHKCDANYLPGDISYRRCCNPYHLFLGTQQDNITDMIAKGRQARRGESSSECQC